MDPEERAREGLFLAFQYPVEIPGVNSTYFLKAALNEIRKHKGQTELDAMEFLTLVKDKIQLLELNEDLLRRSVNEGFSGGEKKRNEIFQMAVLEPRLAILDETDSGLDIDALKIVSNGVNKLRRPGQRATGHHALPAAAELHRAGFRARAGGWAHRADGRQEAGAGAGREGLRLDHQGRSGDGVRGESGHVRLTEADNRGRMGWRFSFRRAADVPHGLAIGRGRLGDEDRWKLQSNHP